MQLKSNQGYEAEAEKLLVQYEQFSFEEGHSHILDLIPTAPAKILDIGAGSGKAAAYFADKGHRVVAVEPTDAMRLGAQKIHPSANIEWIDDHLPGLEKTKSRARQFDFIMMNAVWMHLDQAEREQGMPAVESLLKPNGVLAMNLRHGPVPAGRRMFEIPTDEMLALAAANFLEPLRQLHTDSLQDLNRRASVTWTHFAFQKDQASAW